MAPTSISTRALGEGGALSIAYALSAVKGVGEAQAEALVAARGDRPFASLSDMARRIDPRAVNKKALESLAAAGAFDEIEPDRARAFAAIEPALALANRTAPGEGGRAERRCSARAIARRSTCAPSPGRRPTGCGANSTRSGFFSPAIRSTPIKACLTKLRVTRWADFARARPAGRDLGAPCRQRARPRRAAHQIGLASSASSSFPIRPANMRRSFSPKASTNIATCSKKARTCW